jgi:uncharacterized protein YcnI
MTTTAHRSARRSARRRLAAALGLAAGIAVLAAGPAGAHIHTDPEEAAAGSHLTVGFEIEHGCDGSPTVELSLEIPAGVNDAVAEPLPGWTSSVESGVARWTGGSLPDDSPGVFPLTMTLPAEAGPLAFKMIQRCTVGSLEWIEDEVEGQPEPEHPAPILEVTAADPASTTTEPPSTTTPGSTEPPSTTNPIPPTSTTTIPVDDGSGDDDDSSALPYVLGGLAAVVVVGGGGYALYRNRNSEGS